MPFADDLRDLDAIMAAGGLNNNERTEKPIVDTLTKEEKYVARNMIKNMTFDFQSYDFENPTI